MTLTLANKFTIGRILAVPFFIAALIYYSPDQEYLRFVALGVFLLAILTDVIDGYIARRHHQKTKAGAILDPLADKVLLLSAFICLYRIKTLAAPFEVPQSILLIVISRDVILLTGAALIHMVHGDLEVEPSVWGKAATFFQVVAVIGVLLHLPIFPWTWYIVALFTIVSGFGYVKNGVKVINVASR